MCLAFDTEATGVVFEAYWIAHLTGHHVFMASGAHRTSAGADGCLELPLVLGPCGVTAFSLLLVE